MKKKFLILFLIIALLSLGLTLYLLLRHRSDHFLTLYGNVDVRQVDIGFRVPGQVEELFFEEGDYVCSGEVLARLCETPYISQVEEASATLEAVSAKLYNAQVLMKRRQELVVSGGVSQEDLDNATTNCNTLLAEFALAEAALAVAKDNLTYTVAYAPTEAIVLTRIKEPGSVVNPADPVYTLSVVSPVWIRAYVSEKDLGKIYYGMDAKVYIDTPGAPSYTGKIGFISPVSEFTPKTVETTQLRTDLVYRLRIYVDNPDRILKQGMPVTVKLDTRWMECP